MKKIIIALLFFIGLTSVKAQQLPQYTQYLINDFVMNPAIAGSRPFFDAKSNHRYQWIGIRDAPRTYIFSLHGPINLFNMGVGGYLYTDIVGPSRRTGVQLAFAKHFKINDNLNFSFGVSGGIQQFLIDGAKVTLNESNDIALSNGIMSVLTPDASAGGYLYGDNVLMDGDKLFFGFSAPQLLTHLGVNKLQFFDNYDQTISRLEDHYFVTAGYTFKVHEDFDIQPSGLAKYVEPSPIQFDLTMRGIYKDFLWIGGSYRSGSEFTDIESIGVLAGYSFQKNLMLGYSYDISMSDIRNYNSGSHELMFGIRFKNRKKDRKPEDASSIE